MRLFLRIVALASALVSGTADAAIDSARVNEAKKAATAFQALAKNSHVTGQAPRQADPAVKALLDKVLDTTAVDQGVTFSDIPRVEEWMGAGQKVAAIYLLAGTGATNFAKLTTSMQNLQRINRNIAEFQGEYGRCTDFQIAMAGAMLDGTQSRLEAASPKERDDPKTRTGIADVSARATQSLIGVVSTFLNADITDDWRRARSARLVKAAPKMKTLTNADADKLRTAVGNVEAVTMDAVTKASLKTFAEALPR